MASGDKADTSQGRKKPSGTKAKKLSQKEQSERFIETARKLDADDTGLQFKRALEALVPPKKARRES